jgi:hypothetical protein
MSPALLAYVLKQLLIGRDSPEGSSNVKVKDLLHLEKQRKRKENNFAGFINLFNLIINLLLN